MLSPELLSALIAFVLLLSSAGLGTFVRHRLPEHHRSRETTELLQVAINLLVTFAALVLGLLTASVKQNFDRTAHDWEGYTLQLSILDDCLRSYGGETSDIRNDLHAYVAGVIASTWQDTPLPPALASLATAKPRDPHRLGAFINQIGTGLNQLVPATPFQHRQFAMCLDRYKDVLAARLRVLEDSRAGLFQPFYAILLFWLMIMFACFGFVTPINRVTAVTTVLCAISLSSVIFVIVDLSTPYTGLFAISSDGARDALMMMLTP
ncbi:MAG: hypothetical protein JSS43_00915 [Proteobacteria bacterium]|nr:hypothetical protein [Pseudomonadota bacterium]